ncbi:MAG: septum formation initiator family protein, partial [Anaerolineae bacterium]|nr:septum formation initiator family protein [Anaerolineae bacterium]
MSQNNAGQPPSQAPHRPRSSRRLSSSQVTFAVILTVGLMLAIQFSSQISGERDLNRIRNTIEDEIALLRQEQTQLIDQLAYVESDAYVEDWARSEGRMVREGEVLVVAVAAENSANTVQSSQPVIPPEELQTTLPEPDS